MDRQAACAVSHKPIMKARSLGLIGLLGGVGGAINAWLCYAKLPVPIRMAAGGADFPLDFPWYIMPGGAFHGLLLAVLGTGLAVLCWKHQWFIRWAGLPVAGYVGGWLSFIPLGLSLGQDWSHEAIVRALAWPWNGETSWGPYTLFGWVSLLLYGFLNLCRLLRANVLLGYLLMGSVSGSLGSLWWWMEFERWYFSLIHGTIWGSLVGFGVWRAVRDDADERLAMKGTPRM
jgi:hypothetical protein